MSRFLLHLVRFPDADSVTISSECTPLPGGQCISSDSDCKTPSNCRNMKMGNNDLFKSKNMIINVGKIPPCFYICMTS